MDSFLTRASSINRALDQIGDKWCLLLIQEMLWGTHTYKALLDALGISRGVLSNRLKWLESNGCVRRDNSGASNRPRYHLTRKSVALYDCALMAVVWENHYYARPELDVVKLVHRSCGQLFSPKLACNQCSEVVIGPQVSYRLGPGVTEDIREKKVRRRSSLPASAVPSQRNVYRNLVNLVGDRWTANLIALTYHGLTRYDQLNDALPVATSILSSRLKLLRAEGIVQAHLYQNNPPRYEYVLTQKGWDLFPWFLTLLQWGDQWCDITGKGRPLILNHNRCGQDFHGIVVCDQCDERLSPDQVDFHFGKNE